MSRRLVVPLLTALVAVTGCTTGGAALGSGRTSSHGNFSRAVQDVFTRWRIRSAETGGIAGYADTTSVAPGQPVTLYVSSAAGRFSVRFFRMGWYGGRQAVLVRTVRSVPVTSQPAPTVLAPTNTVVAQWRPTVTLDTHGLQPGDYLLRLDARDGTKTFVPLAVRAPSAAGTVVLVSPVTTWEAYNRWGCCDLYAGASGSFVTRSRAVSFDRPYTAEDGAGEFISRQLPVLAEAERLRLRLDYVTDIDLDRDPHLLDGAKAVISMGHDEYWSPAMRAAVTAARDAGTNLAFLGANAVYRRIRFDRSPLGPDRVEVDYKIAAEDPLLTVDKPAVTSDWAQPPDPQPESTLTGESYGCFTKMRTPAVVTEPTSPLLAGTGLTAGATLRSVVGFETDRVLPGAPRPARLEILMHSPFPCPQGFASYADTTYYTAASQAGVFDSGTQSWVCAMSAECASPAIARVLQRITDNLLTVFAHGPAGAVVPAADNIARVYPGG